MRPKFYPLLSLTLVSLLMDPMNIVLAQRAPSSSSSSLKRSKTAPVSKSFSRAAAVKSRPSKTRSVPSVGSKTISPSIRSGSSGRYVPKPVSRPPAKSPLNSKAGKFSKNAPLPPRSKSTQLTLPRKSSSKTSGRFGYSPSGVRLPVARIPGSPKKAGQQSSKKILHPGISRSVVGTATKSSLRTGVIQELGNPQGVPRVLDSKVIRGISEAGRQRAANVPPPLPSREAASAISEAGRRQRGRDQDSISRTRESADNALPDSADEAASGDESAEDAVADEADDAAASDAAADQDQDAVDDAVPDAEEIAADGAEGGDDTDHPEEHICSHHCVGHCHHHGIHFGLDFPLWGFAYSPDGIFIRAGHRYAAGYTEEIVAVEPENTAVEIRELSSLPQVHAAATVSLSSETALGQQPGQVFLDVNGIVLPTTVVTWSNESATCTLPMMGVDQSKTAQLIMVTAEGTVAHWIAIELLPPKPPQDVPES